MAHGTARPNCSASQFINLLNETKGEVYMKRVWLNTAIAIAIVIAFAVLAIPQAEAMMTRGVFVNGMVHILGVVNMGRPTSKSTDNYITHVAATPDATTLALPFSENRLNGDTITSAVCNLDDTGASAMNGAVFQQKIYFVFTGAPISKKCGCNCPSGTNLYITYWDLTNNTFAADVDANNNPIFPMNLGPVYHQNYSRYNSGDIAGAAIVVFNNLLYVFSDSGIYTSGDGINWNAYPGFPTNNEHLVPLDAITYYPQDADPMIMIISGSTNAQTPGYNTIWAANWNGQVNNSGFQSQQLNITAPVLINAGVALLSGTATTTNTSFTPGARQTSLQLFLGGNSPAPNIVRLEYSYNQTGGQWANPEQFSPPGGYPFFHAFPWYTTECTSSNNVQRQNLVINYPVPSHGVLAFTSDAMVPQNNDIPLSCTSSGGTATDTGGASDPDTQAALQKYWTLVGVIMGSPPFAINGVTGTDIEALSNVTYGQSQTGEVSNSQETENSVMVSAGVTVQAGIEHVFGIQDQVDSSYKHAWESSHETSTTSTVSYAQKFGTESTSTDPSEADQIGMYGWAIYHVPTIVVQDYALYAYDYNTNTNTGTPIGQDVHTTQVQSGLSYRPVNFELANPGGPNDTYPGLMTGVAPLTKSTDFTGWKQGWESASETNHYTTLLGDSTVGDAKINTITFVAGSNGNVSFSQEIETVTTTGNTSDVEVSNKTSLDVGTELAGFKADLTVGYDGHFSNSVTTTTTLGSDVEAGLGMSACSEPGCIKSLTIQPYLLQAEDANAPWVPTGYNSQLPWAMHWKIVSYQTISGNQFGMSPPADRASGTVVGSSEDSEEASGSRGSSSYSLRSGKMVWQEQDGTLKPIPMSAREFDPALGVSVKLNGYTWSSSQANGRWKRHRNIWTFKTSKSVKSDIVALKLNFARMTWDFDLSRADLSPFLKVSEGQMHLELNVNGKYVFYFDCAHEVEGQWDHNVLATAFDERLLSLGHYNGSFDPSTGKGSATLEGDLPGNLQYFGDISFVVNGRQFDLPLISHKHYAKALAGGKKLVVNLKNGLNLSLDFGKKKWKIYFHGNIDPLLIPRSAVTTIQVKVGGELRYSGVHTVRDYTSKLTYVNPSPTRCYQSNNEVTCF